MFLSYFLDIVILFIKRRWPIPPALITIKRWWLIPPQLVTMKLKFSR